jgi:glutamyl-tRNA synthetase
MRPRGSLARGGYPEDGLGYRFKSREDRALVIRTRFAPSPTGDLHLGGAWTALASWALARRAGGALVLRIEDLDPPRVVRGSAERIVDDLEWLGLDWDEGPDVGGPFAPYAQSERGALYEAAIEALSRRGLVYACDCSRAEIARVASAPHPGDEAVYPGTCRDAPAGRIFKRDPALRLRLPEGARETIDDGVLGLIEQDVARECGDFVLRRGDGVFAYQLAVVVDDLAMGITDVIRGADLASSTPRQALLARLLGGVPPRYAHLPLVVATDGARLAKRTGGASVHALREAGIAASAIVGKLAHGLGMTGDDGPRSTNEALAEWGTRVKTGEWKWPEKGWRVPVEWAGIGAG